MKLRTAFGPLLFAAVVAVAGCDSKGSTSAGAPASPEDATPSGQPDGPAPVLALGDAKLFEVADPGEAIEITANGSVRYDGEVVGTLSTDGKMTLPDGRVALQVGEDGAVSIEGGDSGLVLTDTGATVSMGPETVTITFEADGKLTVAPPPGPGAPPMGHEGCTGEMVKTCALVMFGAMMPANVEETSLPPASAADGPAAIPPAAE